MKSIEEIDDLTQLSQSDRPAKTKMQMRIWNLLFPAQKKNNK
jgi:hypothetical protein